MSDKNNISEKDRFLDKIFWFKVVVALITGMIYGIYNVEGLLSFLGFMVGMTVLSFVYFKRFVNPDDEVEYQSEIFIEGLNVCVPLFLLVWTCSFTYIKVTQLEMEKSSTL